VLPSILLLATSTVTETSTPSEGAPIEEVVVRAPSVRPAMGHTRIYAEEGRRIPGTQGDAVKVIETIGGVGRPAAGSGELVVWGAAPSDTASYVDGVEVPRLFHLGGSRSVVGDLVETVELVPGGFAAEHGRAVGGLVRVSTGKPLATGVHGFVSADPIDVSLGLKSTFLEQWTLSAGARRSLLEHTFGAFTDERARALIPLPTYWDYQSKLTYTDDEDTEISLSIFGAEDSITRTTATSDPLLRSSERTRSGFHRLAARIDGSLSDDSSYQVVVWTGFDRDERLLDAGGAPAGLDQIEWQAGVRAEERRRLTSFLTLRSGIDLAGTHARLRRTGSLTLPAREGDVASFGLPPGDRSNEDRWNVSIAGIAGHATAVFEPFERLSLEPGLRFELTLLDGDRVLPVRAREPEIGHTELEATIDPRLRIAWQVVDPLSIFGAVGRYHQHPDPADLSPVFGSPILELVSAVHAVLGVRVEVFRFASIELTGFFVDLSRLAVRSRLPTPPQGAALISTGDGRNFGGQLTIQGRFEDTLVAWVSYSFSRAERRDDSDAEWRLFDADQTHNLSAVASWRIGWGFDVGARFRWSSGFPRTPVLGAYYDARTGAYDPIYGERNSIRLPDFIDLSLRVGYTHHFEWATVEAFLDVQNVLNRRNAEEILHTSDFSRSDFITGVPILPVLGVRLEL
jgi:hypothetical protein